MSQEPLVPIFIEVADPATAEITVSDVLIGAFSFTGLVAVIAMVLGVLFAWTLIGLRGKRLSKPTDDATSTAVRLDLNVSSR